MLRMGIRYGDLVLFEVGRNHGSNGLNFGPQSFLFVRYSNPELLFLPVCNF